MKKLFKQIILIIPILISMIFSVNINILATEIKPNLKVDRYVSASGNNMTAKVYIENLFQNTMAVQFDLQTPKASQYSKIDWNKEVESGWTYLQEASNDNKGQITFYIIAKDLPIQKDGSLYIGELYFKDRNINLETTGNLKWLQKSGENIVETTEQLSLDINTITVGNNNNNSEEESTTPPNNNTGGGGNNGNSDSSDSNDSSEEETSQPKVNNDNKVVNELVNFTDIQNHWAKNSIKFIVSQGYMTGMGDNKFAPDETMTRAMLVRILYNTESKILKTEPKSESNGFNDVPENSWFASAVNWAANNGIVYGMGANEFAPNKAITREEMVTMLKRYADFKNLELPVSQEAIEFIDNIKINIWSKDSVIAMQKAGIISGRDDNSFDPQASSTRAEVASAFERFVKNVLEIK